MFLNVTVYSTNATLEEVRKEVKSLLDHNDADWNGENGTFQNAEAELGGFESDNEWAVNTYLNGTSPTEVEEFINMYYNNLNTYWQHVCTINEHEKAIVLALATRSIN